MQTRDRGNKPWNVIINGMHRYGAYNAYLKYQATVGSIASALGASHSTENSKAAFEDDELEEVV